MVALLGAVCGCDGSSPGSDGGNDPADAALADAALADASGPDADPCAPPIADPTDARVCIADDAATWADGGVIGTWAVYTVPGFGGTLTELHGAQIADGVPGTAHPLSTSGHDVGFCCEQPAYRWSPDATRLAYAKRWTQREMFSVDLTSAPPAAPQLVNDYIIDAGRLIDVKWSIDSRKIGYLADAAVEDVAELYVVDVAAPTPWTAPRVNAAFTSLDQDVLWYAFSPDSRWLAFVANQEVTTRFDLYIADVSGSTPGTPVKVSGAQGLVTSPVTVSWSPDGSRLLYAAAGPAAAEGGLYVTRIGSSGPGPTYKVNDPAHAPGEVLWAPRGRRLIYVDPTGIYLVDQSGAAPAPPQLLSGTLDLGLAIVMTWSPDGERLGLKLTGGGTERLYVIATDGPNAGMPLEVNAPLASNSWVTGFVWSPDSSMIAYRLYTGAGTTHELWVSEVLGGAPATPQLVNDSLVSGGSVDTTIRWSPDSTRLLYLADQEVDGRVELFVTRVSCGQVVQRWKVNQAITGDVGNAEWAPDSGSLLFNAGVDSDWHFDLFVARADEPGHEPVQVNQAIAIDPGVYSDFSWARPELPPPAPPACP